MENMEKLKRLLAESTDDSKEIIHHSLDDILVPLFGNDFSIKRSHDGSYTIHYGRKCFLTAGDPNPKIHKAPHSWH